MTFLPTFRPALCLLGAMLAQRAMGQALVRDINTTALGASSNPQNFVASGGLVYFTADDGIHGREVWFTDGNTASIAADLRPGSASSNPGGLIPFQGGVLVSADDGVNGRELHLVSRGSAVLLEINPGSLGTPFGGLVVIGSTIYVVAWTPATGYELWAVAGGSVRLVRDIVVGSGDGAATSGGVVEVNGRVLFNGTDPGHGMELWSSDGTAGGTVLVKDVWPGSLSGLSSGVALVSDGSHAWFAGTEPATGTELWITDGTTGGTRLVQDLVPGTGSGNAEPMVIHDGALYLRAQTPATGIELFRATPGVAAVSLVKDITLGSGGTTLTSFRPAGDLLFFTTGSTSLGTVQIQRTDGTAAGTFPVCGSPGFPLLAAPNMTAVGRGTRVLFQANDPGVTGNEPWLSDGTIGGTTRVLDLEPGPGSSMPSGFTVTGDKVVFAATQTAVGNELFAMPLALTRGCIVETLMPGCPGPGGSYPQLSGFGIPRFGSSGFELRLTQAPANTGAFIGLSVSGNPGAGGCTLQVAPNAALVMVMTSASGFANWPLPVPNMPTLLSFQLFTQAAVQPGSFLGTFSLSNGLRIVVGDY